MEIKQIEPTKVITRLYGHEVEVIITGSTHTEIHVWLHGRKDTIRLLDMDDVIQGLFLNKCSGEIKSTTRIYLDGETEKTVITCEGSWRIIPDYNQWKRVFAWWYSHDFNEALSQDDFIRCYGRWKGSHYFGKWASVERNIPKMIGYIGDNMEEGRIFLDMVMQKVRQFEKRINKES